MLAGCFLLAIRVRICYCLSIHVIHIIFKGYLNCDPENEARHPLFIADIDRPIRNMKSVLQDARRLLSLPSQIISSSINTYMFELS